MQIDTEDVIMNTTTIFEKTYAEMLKKNGLRNWNAGDSATVVPTSIVIKGYIEDPLDIAKRSGMSYDAFVKDLTELVEVFKRHYVSVLGHYSNTNDYDNVFFIAAKIACEDLHSFLSDPFMPNAANNKMKTIIEMLSDGQKNASVVEGKVTPGYCVKMLSECPNIIYVKRSQQKLVESNAKDELLNEAYLNKAKEVLK